MKSNRLRWLFLLMCTLLAFRILVPAHRGATPQVAEAIVRSQGPTTQVMRPPVGQLVTPLPPLSGIAVLKLTGEAIEHDVPGNAFAVPQPPPPTIAPRPPVLAMAPPVPVAPVQPAVPAPPPVPYQAIGKWEDSQGLGIFLSSPAGTLLARAGMTLHTEYLVTAVTAQQLSLRHIPTQRELLLQVPHVSNLSR